MENRGQLNLPRKRGDKVYMSYSQFNSFNPKGNPEFFNIAILQYLFGVEVESRFAAYAKFGTAVGEYLENKSKKPNELLNENDIVILNNIISEIPDDGEYEREIWIDRGNYCILGYEDLFLDKGDVGVSVIDFKTGAIKSKKAEYANKDKYYQSRLYMYYEDVVKNNKVGSCYVILLDRSGNAMADEPEELHLTGDIERVDTPYVREEVEAFLEDMDERALYISELKDTYDKLLELEVEV